MGVSLNGGTQQLLVFLLKIIIWRSFGGTTILGNTHIPISMMTSERTGSEIGPKFHHTSRGPVQDSLLKVWGVFSPWAEFASFLVRLPCICDQLTKCDLTLKHSKTSNCPGFFALLPPVFTLPKTSSPPLNIFPKGKETSVLFPNITKIKKGRKKKEHLQNQKKQQQQKNVVFIFLSLACTFKISTRPCTSGGSTWSARIVVSNTAGEVGKIFCQWGNYLPADSKWPGLAPVWRSLNLWRGHLTISKRAQSIAR